jgi:hypothetical protein
MPQLLLLFVAIALCLGVGEVARRGVLGRRMERSIAAMQTAPNRARPVRRQVLASRPATSPGPLEHTERRAS